MAFQSVPETAEIVVTYRQGTILQNNVMAAFLPGGYLLSDLVQLAIAVDLTVEAEWLPLQTLDTNYEQTLVRGLEFLNDQETVVSTSAGPGLDASEGLPMNVTFSVKKGSGKTGRNARGRLYWMGLPVNQLAANENLLNDTDADNIVDAVEAMRLAITATDWTPCIVSRYLEGVKRDEGEVFQWVETTSVNNNVDTQRRRLP